MGAAGGDKKQQSHSSKAGLQVSIDCAFLPKLHRLDSHHLGRLPKLR